MEVPPDTLIAFSEVNIAPNCDRVKKFDDDESVVDYPPSQ
jgi:hypothetical protein